MDDEQCYLNCAFFSPQLKEVTKVGQEAILLKQKPWEISIDGFFSPGESCREKIADLIGCSSSNVAIIPSASYGLAIAAKNLNVKRGSTILLLHEQFPSNVYAWKEKALKEDLKIEFLVKSDTWTQSLIDRLQSSVDVSLLSLGQVHWTDGEWIDLVSISRICREKEIALVVDGTQSIGACPFDYSQIQPDFLIAAGYKWLQGPYGLGFVVVGEKHLAGEPLEWNWINRAESDNFQQLVNYKNEYQSGARRFDMGGKSQFVLMPMFERALAQVLDWGVQNIAHTLGNYNEDFHIQCAELGLKTQSKICRSPHMFGVYEGKRRFKPDLAQELKSSQVHVSFRGSSIRVSPYLYNTEKDRTKFLEVLSNGLI